MYHVLNNLSLFHFMYYFGRGINEKNKQILI